MSETLARLREAALGPSPSAPLRWFRKACALTLLIYTLTWAQHAREWLTDAGYHLSSAASRGLQLPVPLLDRWSVVAFLTVYVVALLAVLFDRRPRLASAVVLVCLTYVTTADRLAAFSMNKLALVAWLVLVLAPWPEGDGDAQASEGAGELRSAWPLRVLQVTLILQYLGAGICKLRGGWIDDPQVLWLQVQSIYMTDLAAWSVRALPMWAWAGMHYAALAFELLAPVLFGAARLRPLAFLWGLGMHLAIGLMMYRVGIFSLSVVAYYTLFLDPQLLDRLHEGLRERVESGARPEIAR